jgi:hypothetical protein
VDTGGLLGAVVAGVAVVGVVVAGVPIAGAAVAGAAVAGAHRATVVLRAPRPNARRSPRTVVGRRGSRRAAVGGLRTVVTSPGRPWRLEMSDHDRPATHDEPRRDFGAGKVGWPYIAAMALPVAGFFVFGLVGLIVGLVLGAVVFGAMRAAS